MAVDISKYPTDLAGADPVSPDLEPLEKIVSIVMPCLNEAETLGTCILKANQALLNARIRGEVVIADNGSTDGSQLIAMELGARVVNVKEKGYGNALRGGILACHSEFVVFGDSDDSYDFGDTPRFLAELLKGYDLVMGNRFRGGIKPGAMPWKHRYIGNPVLSGIGRFLFRCPVGDFHCGIRGLRRSAFEIMDLRTTGMEFASEMVIKATLKGLRITEIPVVLSPDGRSHPPHLRSWRDGWRHLKFMLLFSPRWLFLLPGMTIFAMGLIASLILWWGPVHLVGVVFDIHTLLLASISCLLGHQLMTFAIFAKLFAVHEGLHPPLKRFAVLTQLGSVERGVQGGLGMMLIGLAFIGSAAWSWGAEGFRALDPQVVMRQAIPGSLFLCLGVQTIFASFFFGMLGLSSPHPTLVRQ